MAYPWRHLLTFCSCFPCNQALRTLSRQKKKAGDLKPSGSEEYVIMSKGADIKKETKKKPTKTPKEKKAEKKAKKETKS